MKIPVCQYQIENLPNWDAYQKKVENIVKNAKSNNANLLLCPEEAGNECAGPHNLDNDLYSAVQPLIPNYCSLFHFVVGDVCIRKPFENTFGSSGIFSPIDGEVHNFEDSLHNTSSQ